MAKQWFQSSQSRLSSKLERSGLGAARFASMTVRTAVTSCSPLRTLLLSTPLMSMLLLSGIAAPTLAQDAVGLGTVWAEAGNTAVVPIVVVDTSFTGLGVDVGIGREIQGLSISVELSDPALASSVAFSLDGITSALTPIFQTTAVDAAGTRHSWILAFDGTTDFIPFNLDLGDVVGRLQITVAPGASVGSILSLTLDVELTALSNQGGTLVATQIYGGLALLDGWVRVEDAPIFTDGFESGDTSVWTTTNNP